MLELSFGAVRMPLSTQQSFRTVKRGRNVPSPPHIFT